MKPIPNKVRQMLQALLLSEDRDAGLLAYELITKRTSLDKVLPERLLGKPEELRIFWHNVVTGNLEGAIACANSENEYQLKHVLAYQMLQALLNCEEKETRKAALSILSGEVTIKQFLKSENSNLFFQSVLSNDVLEAYKHANKRQLEALNNICKLQYTVNVLSPQNLQRLNYLLLDFNMTLDQCFNDMVKAYYETVRADQHAELLQKEKPQSYFI